MTFGARRSGLATLLAVAIFVSGSAYAADAEEAGTVALVSGKAWVRHGEIMLPEGAKANDPNVKPEVRFHDNFEKELGPNDTVLAGDVILTADDSYLKIYFKDDSIMDIGPKSTFKVQQFQQNSRGRNISFQMLYGKIRTLVTRALGNGSTYRVATPVSTMGVRGTEWVTHAYLEKNQYKTDITVLEGKVVVDVAKLGPNGKLSTQQITVTPGNSFRGQGLNGVVHKFNLTKLSAPALEKMVAVMPAVELKRGGAAAAPGAGALPGTGVAPDRVAAGGEKRGADRKLASVDPVAPNAPGAPGGNFGGGAGKGEKLGGAQDFTPKNMLMNKADVPKVQALAGNFKPLKPMFNGQPPRQKKFRQPFLLAPTTTTTTTKTGALPK